jgi:hypothetical protein
MHLEVVLRKDRHNRKEQQHQSISKNIKAKNRGITASINTYTRQDPSPFAHRERAGAVGVK